MKLPTLTVPSERFELSCGATLLVSHSPGAPVAAIDAHVRGGPSLDPEGLEGTAFLTGGLADQGTRSHSEEEIAALLEPYGGDIQGESSGLAGTIVSEAWKELASLMCEMLQEPTFPVAKVRRHKERLLQRLQNEAADPRHLGAMGFRKLIYGDHWLGRPAYGMLGSVARIEPRHLRAQHRKHWVASRGVIAFCGAAEPEEVRRFFERRLRDWRRGKPLEKRNVEFPKPRVAVRAVRADRKQVQLYLGHLGIRRSNPDYSALVVLDHVLGQGPGFTDRISRRLRDELGLAYSVSAGISGSAGLTPGTFMAYIGTSPEHVTTALHHFRTEVRRIQEELVPQEELRLAKDYLVGSFSMGFERSSRRAGYLVSAEVHELPADNLECLPRQFEAVTPAEIQRVAREHLFPDHCALCAAGPVRVGELRRALAPA
jgi:zinc protease